MTFVRAVEEGPRKSTTVITADGLPLMTRRQLVPFLNANGIPITWSTLNKLCAPRVGQGPPIAAYWGNKKLYAPQPSLDWARSRLRGQQADFIAA
jgi:hypothetical protein